MSNRRGPKISLSQENKAALEEERVTLCHCGRPAQKHDNERQTCRLHPSCRCPSPNFVRRYMGQRFDRKCGKLEAA